MPNRTKVPRQIRNSPTFKMDGEFMRIISECEDFFANLPAKLKAHYGLDPQDILQWIFAGDMEVEVIDRNGNFVADNTDLVTASYIIDDVKKAAKKLKILDYDANLKEPITWATRPDSKAKVLEFRLKPTNATTYLDAINTLLLSLEVIARKYKVTFNVRSNHLHYHLNLNGRNLANDIDTGFAHPLLMCSTAGILSLFQAAPALILAPRQLIKKQTIRFEKPEYDDDELKFAMHQPMDKSKQVYFEKLDKLGIGASSTSLEVIQISSGSKSVFINIRDESKHKRYEARRMHSHDYFHPAQFVACLLCAAKDGIEKIGVCNGTKHEFFGSLTSVTKIARIEKKPEDELSVTTEQIAKITNYIIKRCLYDTENKRIVPTNTAPESRQEMEMQKALAKSRVKNGIIYFDLAEDEMYATISGKVQITETVFCVPPLLNPSNIISVGKATYNELMRVSKLENNPARQVLGPLYDDMLEEWEKHLLRPRVPTSRAK